jgi:muconate cycloisomerase
MSEDMQIDAVDVFVIRLPAIRDFTISGGSVATSSGTLPRVLTRITAAGEVGWGEATPTPAWSYETTESITSTIRSYLAPALLGEPAWNIDRAHATMDHAIHDGVTTGAPIAKSAIDMALHDLVGRILGVSVGQLWGQRRVDEIPLAWIVSAHGAEAAAEETLAGHNVGYRAFKIKLGIGSPGDDVARVAAVRAAAPDANIWADANRAYSSAEAIRLSRRLDDLGVDVLEQPLRANDPLGSARLREVSPVPIALDESLVHPVDLTTAARLGALDLAVAKVQRSAGLHRSRRLCALAEDLGLGILGSGLTDSALGFAASLHLFAAFGLTYPADLNGPQFIESPYLAGDDPVVVGGVARVPTGPGLGVEIDEKAVRRLSALSVNQESRS